MLSFLISVPFRAAVIAMLFVMYVQYLEVAGRGQDAGAPGERGRAVALHRQSADALLWIIGIEVALVLVLKAVVNGTLAPRLTPLFWLHVTCALTFTGTVVTMYSVLTGMRHRRVHRMLGRYVAPWSLRIMGLTGLVLAIAL